MAAWWETHTGCQCSNGIARCHLCLTYKSQFKRLDKEVCQTLFDKATKGVIKQGKPSFNSFNSNVFDSSVSYISYHFGETLKCPIGHILSPEQIKKYEVNDSKFINDWEEDFLNELIPNSGIVCIIHFLNKLQGAHTDAYVVYKKSKGKSNFVEDYIRNSNVVAQYYSLKNIVLVPASET